MITERLREMLIELAAGSTRECILVAPFMKVSVFRDIVGVLPEGTTLRVFTRWRPMEIALGVSDLEVFDVVTEREYSCLRLVNRLHAKYYRGDNLRYLGSANLTSRGLGGAGVCKNMELLHRVLDEDGEEFERLLELESWTPDSAYREAVAAAATAIAEGLPKDPSDWSFHEQELEEEISVFSNDREWIPQSRSYHALWRVYSGNTIGLIGEEIRQGRLDCIAFGVPPGISENAFRFAVHSRLIQHPLVCDLLESVKHGPKRFGHMRRVCRRLS